MRVSYLLLLTSNSLLLVLQVKQPGGDLEVPMNRMTAYAAESIFLLLGQLTDRQYGIYVSASTQRYTLLMCVSTGLNVNVIDNTYVGGGSRFVTALDVRRFWERVYEEVTGQPQMLIPQFTCRKSSLSALLCSAGLN